MGDFGVFFLVEFGDFVGFWYQKPILDIVILLNIGSEVMLK